jgi:hypothetical protein
MNTSRIDMLGACLAVAVLLLACTGPATPTPSAPATQPEAPLRCLFAGTGATLAFDGKRLNFTCEREGENETGLLGDVVMSDVGWTIEKATIGHGDAGFSLLSSQMVLIDGIELADGTLCAFAGMGATLAFEGKRLNFTCGSPEVGLLGEVRLTEDGWAIEKAVIEHGDSGFTLLSSEEVLITALLATPMKEP